jgi:drug/metabolite transporter (DMT)-like permease
MFVGGIILLLPGLCSLYFILTDWSSETAPMLIIFWAAFFLMGYLGIRLIARAVS